jgi:hypothetical protein
MSAVISGMRITSGQRVKRSTAVRQYVWPADVGRGPTRSAWAWQKAGCRRSKVAQWRYCMAGDFGALAGLASTCKGAAILRDQLRRCFGARCPGATDRGRTGTLGAVGDLELTVRISRQTCRSRRGLVVSPAVVRLLTSGVF